MTSITAEGREGRPALVMRGISKRFGTVQALAEVDLSVRKGTVHAIVGENGAGKTTLMKILAGVYQPDAGTIEINGQRHSFDGPQQAIVAGVSMIYQDLDLAEHLTVAENVFLGNEPRKGLRFVVDLKKMTAATADLADGFGFEINPTATVSSLSTGDCQVAEILKALARKASIIVMDEPTSSLSEDEASRLFEIIRRLKNSDISIIYISHRLDEITGLADDVTILRDGKVAHCGQMAGLDTKTIVRYMVGRELTDFYPVRKTAIRDVVAEVKNLSSQKIQDINFNVRAGEIVGIAGLVGAGRTEIARAIFGVDKKTSGVILLEGQEVKIKSPAEAIANGIAFLTEDRKRSGLCLGLACSWNITLAALGLIGMRRILRPAKETAIADKLGKQLAIKWTSPERQVDTLSGGNQQKLLIARWLLAEAKFLIFDEPTRGIDVGAKKEVYALLNNLAEQGKAILFISSELPELLGVTDRILVMRRGRLAGDLKTSETTQEEIMHLAAVKS
jgi:ABC-type sugar transport system ATPase subunit